MRIKLISTLASIGQTTIIVSHQTIPREVIYVSVVASGSFSFSPSSQAHANAGTASALGALLSEAENQELFHTRDVARMVELIVRGLEKPVCTVLNTKYPSHGLAKPH